MRQDWDNSNLAADNIPEEPPDSHFPPSTAGIFLGLVVESGSWLMARKSYGSVTGLISGGIAGVILGVTFLPGSSTESIIATFFIGALLGAFGGTIAGLVGREITSVWLGSRHSNTAEVLGGLIGGILPAVLIYLALV